MHQVKATDGEIRIKQATDLKSAAAKNMLQMKDNSGAWATWYRQCGEDGPCVKPDITTNATWGKVTGGAAGEESDFYNVIFIEGN